MTDEQQPVAAASGEFSPVGFARETVAVTYTRRRRLIRFTADNEVADQPFTVFEYAIVKEGSDGSVAVEKVERLTVPFNPARLIYMRDPQTLVPTGEVHPWGVPYLCIFSASIDEGQRAAGDSFMDDKPAFAPV